jgi:CubicO group peptidase (beta-lactamase class C family)
MARHRFGFGCILLLILLVAPIAATWLFMKFLTSPLHPDPQAIPAATRAEPSSQWSEAVDRARRSLRAGLAEQNLPGLSVAVGVGGAVVWAEGFGWADIETRMPVTPDTRFRIGTASTVLTSAAAGLLLEQGRLRLDGEIQTYVPQFPKKRWPVTLRQLMAHVGGMGTDGGDEGPLFHHRCEQPAEALEHFAQDELLFEPGTQHRHSKYGWILVSAAVETAAARPFLAFMREQIFRPLGMDHTGAESAAEENPEAVGEPGEDAPFLTQFHHLILKPLGVSGAKPRPATEPATAYLQGWGPYPQVRYGLHVMRAPNLSCYAGSMAFFSTPSDLVRFGLAVNGGKLLQPSTVRLLQTPQQLTSGRKTDYGLGWDLRNVTLAGEPTQAAGLDGELQGHRVGSFMMFPEAGIVVAVMSNISHADTPALALQVAAAFAQAAPR